MKQVKDEALSIRTSGNFKQLLKLAAERENWSVASMVEVVSVDKKTKQKNHGDRQHWKSDRLKLHAQSLQLQLASYAQPAAR